MEPPEIEGALPTLKLPTYRNKTGGGRKSSISLTMDGSGGTFRPPQRKKRTRNVFQTLIFACGLYALFFFFNNSPSMMENEQQQTLSSSFAAASSSSRHLLQAENQDYDPLPAEQDNAENSADPATTEADACPPKNGTGGEDNNFPQDLFTKEQRQHGAIILHIIGIIYMFYALALVCDEFFVPSLDVITEKLGISPDVAGATFMAAGGSAPELFTSIIGVFIAKSDVGIGTIVGSAVFNILFVIAACAFAAKEALSLTAWPLIRDVFFYSVALILLVVFFLDNKIMWWEALILFVWYFAYVGFMKFNESTEDALRKMLGMEARERTEGDKGVMLRKAEYRKGLFHLMHDTINPGILENKVNSVRKKDTPVGGPGSAGIELKTTNLDDGNQPEETRPLNEENQQKGLMIGDTAAGVAVGGGGISQLKTQLNEGPAANSNGNTTDTADAMEMKENGKLQIDNPASNHQGETVGENGAAGGDPENPAGSAMAGDDDEAEQPIDISFPSDGNWKQKLIYIVSFPIMFPLYVTLPDTKVEAKKKYFAITFFGSIIWIALYSYLMVWWATVTGKTFKIPDTVMGLTFLAAGTSVPDLITSVLVAKQGKGDMAVSSSVGSNIFDVTVGLPFPWLLYCAINMTHVDVSSDGIACAVGLLFMMLIVVFLCILIFKWQMTKGMGVLMLFLYIIFVLVTLGFDYEIYECPFPSACK